MAKQNPLPSLDLIDKGLTDQRLQEVLRRCSRKSYSTLWLSYNRITDVGLASLCDVVLESSAPTGLYLEHNAITDQGVKVLLELLANNCSLTTVKLDGNDVSPVMLRRLQTALQMNRLPAPCAPVITRAVPGCNAVTIHFTTKIPATLLRSASRPPTALKYTVDSNEGHNAVGTRSPLTVAGLSNGHPYTFTVTGTFKRSSKPSPHSAPVIPTGCPAVPRFCNVISTGQDWAEIAFDHPHHSGGLPLESFTVVTTSVHVSDHDDQHTQAQDLVPPPIVGYNSPIRVSPLCLGQKYRFAIFATNAAGSSPLSSPTDIFLLAGPPHAPQVFQAAEIGAGKVLVHFSCPLFDGGSTVEEFVVICRALDHKQPIETSNSAIVNGAALIPDEGEFRVRGQESPLTVTGLLAGRQYRLSVAAINAKGVGPEAPVPVAEGGCFESTGGARETEQQEQRGNCFTAVSVPGAPIVLKELIPRVDCELSDSAGEGIVYVPFLTPRSDGGSPIKYFQVTIDPACVTLNENETMSDFGTMADKVWKGDVSPVAVTGLKRGATYAFRVAAVNEYGAGPLSSTTVAVNIVPSCLQTELFMSLNEISRLQKELELIKSHLRVSREREHNLERAWNRAQAEQSQVESIVAKAVGAQQTAQESICTVEHELNESRKLRLQEAAEAERVVQQLQQELQTQRQQREQTIKDEVRSQHLQIQHVQERHEIMQELQVARAQRDEVAGRVERETALRMEAEARVTELLTATGQAEGKAEGERDQAMRQNMMLKQEITSLQQRLKAAVDLQKSMQDAIGGYEEREKLQSMQVAKNAQLQAGRRLIYLYRSYRRRTELQKAWHQWQSLLVKWQTHKQIGAQAILHLFSSSRTKWVIWKFQLLIQMGLPARSRASMHLNKWHNQCHHGENEYIQHLALLHWRQMYCGWRQTAQKCMHVQLIMLCKLFQFRIDGLKQRKMERAWRAWRWSLYERSRHHHVVQQLNNQVSGLRSAQSRLNDRLVQVHVLNCQLRRKANDTEYENLRLETNLSISSFAESATTSQIDLMKSQPWLSFSVQRMAWMKEKEQLVAAKTAVEIALRAKGQALAQGEQRVSELTLRVAAAEAEVGAKLVKLAQGQAEIESRGCEIARLEYQLECLKGGWRGGCERDEEKLEEHHDRNNDHVSDRHSQHESNSPTTPVGSAAQSLPTPATVSAASVDDACESSSENPYSDLESQNVLFENLPVLAPSANHRSPIPVSKSIGLLPVSPGIVSTNSYMIAFVFEYHGEFGLTLDETDLTIVRTVRGQAAALGVLPGDIIIRVGGNAVKRGDLSINHQDCEHRNSNNIRVQNLLAAAQQRPCTIEMQRFLGNATDTNTATRSSPVQIADFLPPDTMRSETRKKSIPSVLSSYHYANQIAPTTAENEIIEVKQPVIKSFQAKLNSIERDTVNPTEDVGEQLEFTQRSADVRMQDLERELVDAHPARVVPHAGLSVQNAAAVCDFDMSRKRLPKALSASINSGGDRPNTRIKPDMSVQWKVKHPVSDLGMAAFAAAPVKLTSEHQNLLKGNEDLSIQQLVGCSPQSTQPDLSCGAEENSGVGGRMSIRGGCPQLSTRPNTWAVQQSNSSACTHACADSDMHAKSQSDQEGCGAAKQTQKPTIGGILKPLLPSHYSHSVVDGKESSAESDSGSDVDDEDQPKLSLQSRHSHSVVDGKESSAESDSGSDVDDEDQPKLSLQSRHSHSVVDGKESSAESDSGSDVDDEDQPKLSLQSRHSHSVVDGKESSAESDSGSDVDDEDQPKLSLQSRHSHSVVDGKESSAESDSGSNVDDGHKPDLGLLQALQVAYQMDDEEELRREKKEARAAKWHRAREVRRAIKTVAVTPRGKRVAKIVSKRFGAKAEGSGFADSGCAFTVSGSSVHNKVKHKGESVGHPVRYAIPVAEVSYVGESNDKPGTRIMCSSNAELGESVRCRNEGGGLKKARRKKDHREGFDDHTEINSSSKNGEKNSKMALSVDSDSPSKDHSTKSADDDDEFAALLKMAALIHANDQRTEEELKEKEGKEQQWLQHNSKQWHPQSKRRRRKIDEDVDEIELMRDPQGFKNVSTGKSWGGTVKTKSEGTSNTDKDASRKTKNDIATILVMTDTERDDWIRKSMKKSRSKGSKKGRKLRLFRKS